MNRKYFEAMVELRKLRKTQADDLFLARQMACSMAMIGSLIKISVDGEDLLVADDLKDKLSDALNFPREQIEKVFTVFIESGLLSLEVDKEKRRKVIRFDAAERLNYFNHFILESKNGPVRKLIKAGFTTKEIRVLVAMVRQTAKKEGVDIQTPQRVLISELNESLVKDMRVSFDEAVLEKPFSLSLLTLEGEGDGRTVVFTPADLARTFACLDALKRLGPKKQIEPEEIPLSAA